jgi:tripartite-type tricarboxylate transporter receptor subunit TctC
MFASAGRFLRVGVISFLAASVGSLGAAAQEPVSFKGKTVTVLVGSEPGGGTDASGRLFAPFLSKYLPGQPNVIVQNMPGASGVTALNHFVVRTQPDGLTVIQGSISMIDPITYRRANAQYDPKTLPMIAGIGRGGTAIFMNKDGEKRLYDKSQKPVVIGSALAIPRQAMQPALWGIEYLGWNAMWVVGYPGTNEVMLALDRGEIDMTSTGNIFQIKDRLDNGKLVLVNQTGSFEDGKIVPRAEFGNTPLFTEQMKGKITDPIAQKAFDYWVSLNSVDKWLALAPGTPDNVVAVYRETLRKMLDDKEFMERGMKISDGFEPVSAKDVEFIAKTLAETPPEAIDFTKNLMRKQGIRIQ